MINRNARRAGAAGVIARALGTLGAAMLLLTSTGWGALAGDTGFGAINLKAYQGAAAAVPGPAPKGGNNAAQQPNSNPSPLPYSNYQVQKDEGAMVDQMLLDYKNGTGTYAYPMPPPSPDPHHATQNPNNYPWTGLGPSGHGSHGDYGPGPSLADPGETGMDLGTYQGGPAPKGGNNAQNATQNPNNYPWTGLGPSGHGSHGDDGPGPSLADPGETGMHLGTYQGGAAPGRPHP